MKVFPAAKGNCVVCGKSAEGSVYWTPPPKEKWDLVRLRLAHDPRIPVSPWSGVKLVQNIYFIEPYCKPFCSPNCVVEYYKTKADDNCKRGG